MLRPIVGIGIALAVVVSDADAQSVGVPRAGDVVRVESPSVNGQFTLVRSDSTILVLRQSTGEEHSVTQASVTRLDVRAERPRGSGFLRGAGLGVLAGGVVGVVSGFAAGDDPDNHFFQMSAGEKAAVLGVLLGGAGGLVGGVIGLAAPGHRWEPVQLQRLTFAPWKSGGTVAVSFVF